MSILYYFIVSPHPNLNATAVASDDHEEEFLAMVTLLHQRSRQRPKFQDLVSCQPRYEVQPGLIPPPQPNLKLEIETWIEEQRGAYRVGTLSKAKASRLEVIPGWRWK